MWACVGACVTLAHACRVMNMRAVNNARVCVHIPTSTLYCLHMNIKSNLQCKVYVDLHYNCDVFLTWKRLLVAMILLPMI